MNENQNVTTSAQECEISCPQGCNPITAPKPNPQYCLICNNTGWVKPGTLADKSKVVEFETYEHGEPVFPLETIVMVKKLKSLVTV